MGKMQHVRRGDQGMALIEVVFAAALLSLIIVGAGGALTAGMVERCESMRSYRAIVALRDLINEVQAVANMPENIGLGHGVSAIYSRYNGTTVPLSGIPGGQIVITCYAQESAVPEKLGGPQDLNFDGDTGDNLGGLANGIDFRLVPMQFELTHGVGNEQVKVAAYRLVAKTSNG